jgi:hypothetical protein
MPGPATTATTAATRHATRILPSHRRRRPSHPSLPNSTKSAGWDGSRLPPPEGKATTYDDSRRRAGTSPASRAVTLPCRLRDPRFGAAGDSIPLTERMPRTAVARVLALVALAAVVSTGCTSSHHKTAAEPATPVKRATPARTSPATAPAPAVAVPMCSAAQGILVPSAPPFTNADRLIQPFAYLNQGPPCFADGFPIVQLYDAEHQFAQHRRGRRDYRDRCSSPGSIPLADRQRHGRLQHRDTDKRILRNGQLRLGVLRGRQHAACRR